MTKLAILFIGVFMTVSLFVPVGIVAAEDVLNPVCKDTPQATACQSTGPETPEDNSIYGPNGILTKVVQLILIVVGVVSVIMIIIGGFKYVISSGDPSNVSSAKNTILYAIVGLVIAVMAQGIIVFVVSRL